MKRFYRVLCVLLALALLCSFAWAAPGVRLAAIPPNGIFAPGDTVKIPVQLTENPGIICARLEVKWDPASMRLAGIDYGLLPNNGTAPLNGNTGRHLVCVGDDLAEKNYTESGTLCTLSFEILAAGSGAIELSAVRRSVLNFDLQVLEAQAAGCTVTIQGEGDAPTPTIQPTPAKTPDSLLKNAILLPVGSYAALVKGGVTAIYPGERSVTAYIKNNRTYVPLRFVAEKLGAQVDWDNATRTVTVEKNGHVLKILVGSDVCTLDGAALKVDAPAEIRDNRTMVPLRLVAEGLQYQVEWDAANRVAIVSDGETWDMTGATEKEAISSGLGMIAMFKGFV